MFDFDAGKLLVIGVVALIVIGPKELPRVLRQVGQALGKLRRMAGEFQTQFMDAMKEAELDDLRKEAAKLADAGRVNVDFNPVATLKSDLTSALEGKKETSEASADDPAIAASLREDPDGVFLPTKQAASVSTADFPLPEPAPDVSFPQIGEHAIQTAETAADTGAASTAAPITANAQTKIEGKKEGAA
ncbi:MAG: twin-arginine translocase subunit TatB [Alphaproteobacteria bacterium]|nr:twin-arginine translocase subunit TatB [Alphaproteobacteria bacterium]